MRDRLVEIKDADLTQLRDLYLRDWPRNIAGYSVVETCVRWLREHPAKASDWFKMYCLGGNWSDGTFVCVHRSTWIFVDTLADNTDRLAVAMQLVDWQSGFKVTYFMDRYLAAYLSVEQRMQLSVEREDCFLMYHMPRDQSQKLVVNVPEGLVLLPLKTEHATLVNDAWPSRHEGSLAWFEHVIESNPSIGLFTQNTGELIGWTLKYENGPIGSIYVTDAFKRRGLGTVLLNSMARIFANLGLDAFAFVKPRNLASRQLFEKSGFTKQAEPIWWVHTRPDVSESSKL